MFRNYLTIAIRNLLRQKVYSAINVLGLATGLACCILLLLYVRQELSYDTFHEKADRIYRIAEEATTQEGKTWRVTTPFPLAPAFKQAYPEVEEIARLLCWDDEELIESGEDRFYESGVCFADPELFEIFTFQTIKGQRSNPLSNPGSIVLTTAMARKYFGGEEPIGKTISLEKINYQVSAVVEDLPENSHFHFNFVAPLHSMKWVDTYDSWTVYGSLYTYALFSPEFETTRFGQKVQDFRNQFPIQPSEIFSKRVFLQPLEDIHLHSHFDEIEVNNTVANLIILTTLAAFILLLACINFINLATARSAHRAREIGVRKVLGSTKAQLVKQFIGESVLISLFGAALAIVFAKLSLPSFSLLVGKNVQLLFSEDWQIIGLFFAIAILVGFVAGIYPAVFLSRYEPTVVLKGRNLGKFSRSLLSLRKVLILSQFSISVMLVIGTLTVHRQLHFLQNTDLGFDKEYNIIMPLYFRNEVLEAVKYELLQHPSIISVSLCNSSPIDRGGKSGWYVYPENGGGDRKINSKINLVDLKYMDHFGFELVTGKKLSRKLVPEGDAEFVVNEAMAAKMGYTSPEEIIGKRISVSVNNVAGTIVGVAKNYHIASLHENIRPLALMYYPMFFYKAVVKIHPQNMRDTLEYMEGIWNKFQPEAPFRFSFLSDDINRLYEQEEQTRKIIATFSVLALFVACIGLLGLAAFDAERRTKEIGIRKVIGASTRDIIFLLAKESLALVLIANIIAAPIAFFAMNRWLQNFAYRIDLDLETFLLPGIMVLAIALITVSSQAFKAALANPVESMRYE